ncbi:MAG: hypothetical protein Q9228_005635, partial [Teloschistes exilis]
MEQGKDISKVLLPRKLDHQPSTSPKSSVLHTHGASTPPSTESSLSLSKNKTEQDTLAFSLNGLTITPKLPMAERMFASLGVVFQHAYEEREIELGLAGWNSRLLRADELSRQGDRDIEVLRWVHGILDQMLDSHSEDLIEAANILANGARDETWRLPFEQAGILSFFLRLLTVEKEDEDIVAPCLRFIGNACADTDPNREQAIAPEYLPSLIDEVNRQRLLFIAVPVIYNICNEYDDLAECPDESVRTLVRLLEEPDIEPTSMLQLVNTIGVFLQQDRFQRDFIESDCVSHLLELLLPVNDDLEMEEELSTFRSATNQILSDISATGAFANKYTVRSAVVGTLVQWLSTSRAQLRICSCLTLGNLARSDPVCRDMVSRLDLHERLLEILQDQPSVQVSYAALGFLRNLALPTENKSIIGSQGAVKIISEF